MSDFSCTCVEGQHSKQLKWMFSLIELNPFCLMAGSSVPYRTQKITFISKECWDKAVLWGWRREEGICLGFNSVIVSFLFMIVFKLVSRTVKMSVK